jgi:hypothetical protein
MKDAQMQAKNLDKVFLWFDHKINVMMYDSKD